MTDLPWAASQSLAGGLATVLTIMVYALPAMRHLDANLPDFILGAQIPDSGPKQDDNITPLAEPSAAR